MSTAKTNQDTSAAVSAVPIPAHTPTSASTPLIHTKKAPSPHSHHTIPTSAFTPVNDLPLEIKEPIKITTSKKWFLPPRPKPGRKPISSTDVDFSMIDSNPSSPISSIPTIDKDSFSKSKVSKPEIHPHTHYHNSSSNTTANGTQSYRQIPNEKKCFSFPPGRTHSISNILPTVSSSKSADGTQSTSVITSSLVSSPTDLSSSNCISPKSTSSCIPTPSPTPDSLSPKLESNSNLNVTTHHHPLAEKKRRTVAKLNDKRRNPSNTPNTTTIATTTASSNYNNKMIEVDCSIIHNPIKTEILKINEENYYLKLEVIRLVSNLKSLRDEIQPIVEKKKLKSNKTTKKDKSSSTNTIPASTTNNKSTTPASSTNTATPAVTHSVSKTLPAAISIPDAVKSSSAFLTARYPLSATPKTATTTTTTITTPIAGLLKSTKQEVPSKTQPQSTKLPEPKAAMKQVQTSATATTTTTTTKNKKRSHDDDINDLILSLIDLSHSQQTSDPKQSHNNNNDDDDDINPKNTMNSINPNSMITIKNIKTETNMNIKQNQITNIKIDGTANTSNNVNIRDDDEIIDIQRVIESDIDIDLLDTKKLSTSSSTQMQSPMFTNELANDPFLEFSSKSLLDKQILYDEDDIDLLSTVSTTPSTMFSLSLSATNDTVDSLTGSAMLVNGLDNIDEMPPFELLNLPDDNAIANGKLSNYNLPKSNSSASANKLPVLDTFSLIEDTLNGNMNVMNGLSSKTKIGSLELLNLDERQSSEQLFNDGINGMYSNDIVDFAMSDDVDLEFENFISGKNTSL